MKIPYFHIKMWIFKRAFILEISYQALKKEAKIKNIID